MRKSPIKILFVFIFFSLPLLLLHQACGMSNQEKFIQGEWEGSEQQTGKAPPQAKGPILGISVDWKFENGKFNFAGYPPLKQEGKYRVMKETASSITLEFYDQK